VLNARCEQLAEEFKLLDKRMQEKVAELEDRQQRELKKQRESILTAEKIRRDNWMQEKSKEIKEMTVKGLQPEIERLLAKVLYVNVCVCSFVSVRLRR
jgi:5-azacytidine-induced protein 1